MGTIDKKLVAGREGEYTKLTSRGFKPGFVRKPHISNMLDDAYIVIQNELQKLKAKAVTDEKGLSEPETKRFAMLCGQLANLAKEEREQLKDDALDVKSDEELLELMKEAGGVLAKK